MTNTQICSPSSTLIAIPESPTRLSQMRIRHPRVMDMKDELSTLIYEGSQDSILLVCGPTGVGKTTLAEIMVESAIQESKSLMDRDAGIIPAIYVEAPSSGETEFSWRLFYHRILAELEGSFSMPKTAYGVDITTNQMVKPGGSSRNTLSALRLAVGRAMRERKVQFLVIDEAAHIIRQTRQMQRQLDTLKSIANECEAQILLIGSYDLYQLVSLSGQLARRTHVLHFERYRQDRPEDENAFHACVKKFQSQLPNLWGEQLMRHAYALQENVLGCVGTLNTVLTRAAVLAGKDGKWSVEALRRAFLTDAQRDRILTEILEGETAINPGLTRKMKQFPQKASRVPARSAA